MTNSTNKSPIIILALSLACSAPSADNGADPQATGAVRATEASGGHGYPGDPTIEAGLQLLDDVHVDAILVCRRVVASSL